MLFRVLLPILLFGFQALVYSKSSGWIRNSFPVQKWPLMIQRVLFLVFNLEALAAFIFRPTLVDAPDWFIDGVVYPFYLWHGSWFLIGLLLLIGILFRLIVRGASFLLGKIPPVRRRADSLAASVAYQHFGRSRRAFLRRGMYAVTASSFGLNAYGQLIGRDRDQITETEFTICGLPPQMDGFAIALISDVHSGPFMLKDEMDRYVRLVNDMHADVIVVDGDFVTNTVQEVYPFVESFSNLRAPLGVYGVTGNHEYYTENPDLVIREVNDCGIRLLHNEKVIVEKDGGKVYLIGVDDVGRHEHQSIKLEAAVGQAALGIPRILLCHRPYYMHQAVRGDIDLVLSGHTHGGQIVFGKIGNTVLAPASLATQYVAGKYSLASTALYVSRGVGTIGLPVRINCPPEITRIVLRSSGGKTNKASPRGQS